MEHHVGSEEKLRSGYEAFLRGTPTREEVRARHVLVDDENEARAVVAELEQGADFAELAGRYSKDGGANGGDLGYFTREMMVPEFSAAAFALAVGDFSWAPVKTQFGWHVIKVDDRRQAPAPSFEAAKADISRLYAREVLSQRIKELRDAAGTQIETFTLDGSPVRP